MLNIFLPLLAISTVMHLLLFIPLGWISYNFPSESFFLPLIKILIISLFISLYAILCFSPFPYFNIFISFIVLVIGPTNLKEVWLEDAPLFSYLFIESAIFLVLSIVLTYVAYSKNSLLPITSLFTDFEGSMLLWKEFFSS